MKEKEEGASLWSMPTLTISKEDNPNGLLCESSFSVKYPKHREAYLKQVLPLLKKVLKNFTITVEMDVMESTLEVKTTKDTFDPYAIIKARDMVSLMARGVPLEPAQKVLEDDIFSEVIKIDGFTKSKTAFVKRRFRLIGRDKITLKAMELLTKCYIHVYGKTVSIIGPPKGLQQARTVVIKTMENIHPIYLLKQLHNKTLMMEDPTKANEDWTPLLPQLPKKNQSKRLKPHKIREKKEYTPFPPAPPKNKLDLEMESGMYFANKQQQQWMKLQNKIANRKGTEEQRQKKRNQAFIPPPEPSYTSTAKKAKSAEGGTNVQTFKKKLKRKLEEMEKD